jgi:shikimate kinase
MNIALIGFMGCGKTTIGKILAEKTGKIFYDLDDLIQQNMDKSINDIFNDYGEKKFRELETDTLREIFSKNNLLKKEKKELIISCGGGIPTITDNVIILKENCLIISLSCSPETIFQRLKNDTSRPLLNSNKAEKIRNLLNERKHLYEETADIMVDTEDVEPDTVADLIISYAGKSFKRAKNEN